MWIPRFSIERKLLLRSSNSAEATITGVKQENRIICYAFYCPMWDFQCSAQLIKSDLPFFNLSSLRCVLLRRTNAMTWPTWDDGDLWAWIECLEAFSRNQIAMWKRVSALERWQLRTSYDLMTCAVGESTATSLRMDSTVQTRLFELVQDRDRFWISSPTRELWQLHRGF